MDTQPLTSYTIRKATLEDLPTLLRFEQAIIKFEREFDPTLDKDPISYYDLAALVQSEKAKVVVATVNSQTVASGYVWELPGKPYHAYNTYAHLGFMYVEPEHRGKGLNQLIVEDLLAWAKERGLKEVRLEVYADNAGALRAYEKVGFKRHTYWMRREV